MAEASYCAECGAENESGAVFCDNCGKRLDTEPTATGYKEPTATGYKEPTATAYKEPTAQRHAEAAAHAPHAIAAPVRSRRPIVWIGSAAGLAIVLAGAAFAYQGSLSRFAKLIAQRVMPDASGPAEPATVSAAKPIPLGDTALHALVVSGALPTSLPMPESTGQPQSPPGAAEATVLRVGPSAEKKAVPNTVAVPNLPAAVPPPNGSTTGEAVPTVRPGAVVSKRGTDGIAVTTSAKDPAVAAQPSATRENGETAPPATATVAHIAVGAALSLRSLDKICTGKNKEGDRFRASVDKQVDGIGGASIPQGAIVTFVVDRLRRPPANPNLEFSVAAESIELDGSARPLSATTDVLTIRKSGNSIKGALLGALVGAAATKVAGGNATQAATGGAVGAAAGAAVGSQIKNADGCIERDAPLRITLKSDLSTRAR